MDNFFAELKRRHVYRVAAAYVVVAWAAIQAVNNLSPMLKLPDWLGSSVVVFLFIGFPIALIFAWIGELKTPEGTRSASGVFDWALLAGLVAVIGIFAYQEFAPAVRQTGVETARVAAARPAGISLAVLPFENLSGDPNQEFFSDGMTQEIVAALAKIPDLRVVARGSASQFKGEKKDLRSVGEALGATHLIEGSVRKAGNRVRITAQLVKADDDVNVWVNSYDRQMTDVFAIQEDIATAIAGALRMPLGLKPGEQLVSDRAIDPASYEQLLRGKAALLKARAAYAEQIAILEPVVAKNPRYAPAWAALTQAYAYAVTYYAITASQSISPAELLRQRDAYVAKRDAAAQRSIELDPDSVEGLRMQGAVQARNRGWALYEDFVSKALALDPNDPLTLEAYSNVLLGLGRIKDALRMKQQLHELEPFVPLFAGNYAEALWLDGQTETAIAVLREHLGPNRGAGSGTDLPRILASLGRYKEAADLLSQFPAAANRDFAPAAAALLRTAPAKAPRPETLPPLGNLGFIYLHIGAPERALDYYEQDRRVGLEFALLWHPSYAALRKTERFKTIVRDAGYVEYWRERGWPEFCHPTTGDDFACE